VKVIEVPSTNITTIIVNETTVIPHEVVETERETIEIDISTSVITTTVMNLTKEVKKNETVFEVRNETEKMNITVVSNQTIVV
jgi:hypothetical protein